MPVIERFESNMELHVGAPTGEAVKDRDSINLSQYFLSTSTEPLLDRNLLKKSELH